VERAAEAGMVASASEVEEEGAAAKDLAEPRGARVRVGAAAEVT